MINLQTLVRERQTLVLLEQVYLHAWITDSIIFFVIEVGNLYTSRNYNYRIYRSISRSSSTIITRMPRGVRLMYRMCCITIQRGQNTTRLDTLSIARLWQANVQAS